MTEDNSLDKLMELFYSLTTKEAEKAIDYVKLLLERRSATSEK